MHSLYAPLKFHVFQQTFVLYHGLLQPRRRLEQHRSSLLDEEVPVVLSEHIPKFLFSKYHRITVPDFKTEAFPLHSKSTVLSRV